MIALIPNGVKIAAVTALVFALAVLGAVQYGKALSETETTRETAKQYKEGIQDAQDAVDSVPDDDGAILEWLRAFQNAE